MKLLIAALLFAFPAYAGQTWVAQTLEPGVAECNSIYIEKKGSRFIKYVATDPPEQIAIIPAKKIKKVDKDTIEVDGTVYMTPTNANGVCD